MIRVTVWNEFSESCTSQVALDVYPNGHHEVIKDFLNAEGDMVAVTSVLTDTDQGLSDELLNNTDVLIYWAHCRHELIREDRVALIANRVNHGMGLILLHSAHFSKVFKTVVGGTGKLTWTAIPEKERLFVVNPNHPIVKGIGEYIELEQEEPYGEPFIIPNPDELIFNCWYSGGRVFRGGVSYNRGLGKVFYFQPGHETYKTFYNKEIQKVIINAVRWAKAENIQTNFDCKEVKALD